MRTAVHLKAGASYPIRVFPRSTANPRLGWLYVVGVAGSGRVEAADGGADQPPVGELLTAPGVLGIVVRADAARPVTYTVVAAERGFRFEVHLELAASPESAD